MAGHSRAGGTGAPAVRGPGFRGRGDRAWAGFAGNAQHTAATSVRPQPLSRIRWRAKVDLAPTVEGGGLPIHYGSPMITAANTVLVPTRLSANAGFRVVAYSGASGVRRWSLNTDYRLPRLPVPPLRLRCPPS